MNARALAALPCLLATLASGAEVRGRVTASGNLPARPVADRTLDPACGKGTPGDNPLLTSTSGGLQNAVVRILGASPIAAAHSNAAPLAPITVRQKGCSYVPRVQAALRGQAVVIENQDPMLHNLHAFAGRKGLFNVAQPAGSAPVKREVPTVDVLRLKCDIHPWMAGWVVFNDTPYFAVTDADGRFAIQGVPAGTYELSVWHELLGARTIKVEVRTGAVEVNVDLGQP
jgi:hypothetical protein